jgi:hypothetical protein
MRKFYFTILSILWFAGGPISGLANKTDTLSFYNRESIQCEIKKLSLGKLSVSTINMGTVSIKLEKVAYIESPTIFEIRFKSHAKFFGILSRGSKPGTAKLSTASSEREVNIMDIVSLTPIRRRFIDKIDGNFDLGISYARGSNNFQFNYGLSIKYRDRKIEHGINSNALLTENTQTQTRRFDAGYSFSRYLPGTQFFITGVIWQENSELGVQNRVLVFGSYGLRPVENNLNVLYFSLGLVNNTEESVESVVTTNLESNLRVNYDLFHFASPEIIISSYISAFASITEWGRIRLDGQIKGKWEIFNDFYFNITYTNNFDNQPITEGASNFDYSITAGIGYKF